MRWWCNSHGCPNLIQIQNKHFFMSDWVLFIQNADSLTDLFFGKKIVIS